MSGQTNRMSWFYGSQVACDPLPVARERTYRLVLLGPPGVGKGTQAELLCERLRTCHLSTGDLFRAATRATNPSPAMSAALAAMKRGELVSDDLVMSMVRERTECLKCQAGFLLDGVPRSLAQAEALDAMLDEFDISLDGVLSYELPLDEIVERLGGRRTCAKCRAVYHIVARPPQTAGRCDQCAGELLIRDDDRPEAIRVRMKTYQEVTQPLIDFYGMRNELISVPAVGEPEQILSTSLRLLGEHFVPPRRRQDDKHPQRQPMGRQEALSGGVTRSARAV